MFSKYKSIIRKLLYNFLVAAVLVAASADYGAHTLDLVSRLENITFDWRLARDAETARRKNNDIVIIDIDDESLHTFGGWPWRRDTMAALTRQLFGKYQIQAAGFTFAFPLENDDAVTALDSVKNELLAKGNISAGTRRRLTRQLDAMVVAQYDYDTLFAESMSGRAAILGYAFNSGSYTEALLPEGSGIYAPSDPPLMMDDGRVRWATGGFARLHGYNGNIMQLNDAAVAGGHLNVDVDSDGVVRRVPAIILHGEGRYESMALALMRYFDAGGRGTTLALHQDELRRASHGSPIVKGTPLVLYQDAQGQAERIETNSYSYDMDADATMLLRFGNTGGRLDFDKDDNAAFRYVSAGDVINGNAPKEHLLGKLAIVGSSAGLPGGAYPTAVNKQMPLAEIVAFQIDSARRGDTLYRQPGTRLAEFTMLSILAAVLAVFSVFAGPILSFLLTAAMAGGAGYWFLHQWQESGEVFRIAPLVIVFGGMAVVNILSYFIFESIKGKKLKNAFSQYVPPELADRVGDTVNMESSSREISVLFSDIRGFTGIAERLTPKELTVLMNKILTAQTRVIYHHGGTVDKFIGDAVMAFWNAPLADKEHAQNAVSTALGLHRVIKEVSEEEEKSGNSRMHLGVGICTGVVSVGNMGSEFRMAYTAVGDAVNVASRVEGLTKHYGVPVLVTESTKELCGDEFVFRVVDTVRVKGREQAFMIYEPVGRRGEVTDAVSDALDVFAKMRAAYNGGDFSLAKDLLHEYREAMPDDALGAFYGKKIESLLKSSPREWDGVTVFENK